MGTLLIILALIKGVHATFLAYADDAAEALTGQQPFLNRCVIKYLVSFGMFIIGGILVSKGV